MVQPHLSSHVERQSEREKAGSIADSLSRSVSSLDNSGTNTPALTKAEQNLHTLIGQIDHDYRKAYESQQLQQMQERQLRLMKDRER